MFKKNRATFSSHPTYNDMEDVKLNIFIELIK